MAWEPGRRSSFFSEPVTCITEISLIICDFIRPKMNLNPKLTSLSKIGFKYIEFVENAQSEEPAIYFEENKFGEDVPIKKKEQV